MYDSDVNYMACKKKLSYVNIAINGIWIFFN